MYDNIRLSRKHGVNPCMGVCAFCGEATGEIALMGQIDEQDSEAAREAILNYDPCDKCKENWDQGVAIIEVTKTPNTRNQPPMQHKTDISVYPTGTVIVIKTEAAKKLFQNDKMQTGNAVLLEQKNFQELLTQIGLE